MMMILHCLQKGPYFKDLVLNKNLFGILGPYLKAWGSLLILEAVKRLQVETWIDVQKIKYVVESEFQANEFNRLRRLQREQPSNYWWQSGQEAGQWSQKVGNVIDINCA